MTKRFNFSNNNSNWYEDNDINCEINNFNDSYSPKNICRSSPAEFLDTFTPVKFEDAHDNKSLKNTTSKGSRWLLKILYENFKIIRLNGNIHIYNDKFGYYEFYDYSTLGSFIRGHVPEKFKDFITKNIINETIEWLKSDTLIEKNLDIDLNYINFKNGYLNLNENMFYKHTHNIIFTYFINANYNKNYNKNSDMSAFYAYLKNISDGDNSVISLIQEVLGVIISPYRNYKKAFFLIGSPNSGKSTLLDLISFIIGKDFTSSVNLHDLNDKFRLANIYNKRLNVSGEISELDLNRLDIFKSLTGNDSIQAEFKFGDPFSFTNTASLLFAGNNLPLFKNAPNSSAFFERLVIIPFTKSIERSKIDYDLLAKLKSEVDSICSFAIDGFFRLRKNNFNFSKTIYGEKLFNSYELNQNSIESFLSINCDKNFKLRITKKRFMDKYRDYCINNNIKPMSINIVHDTLIHQTNISYKKLWFNESKSSQWGYEGIDLKTN